MQELTEGRSETQVRRSAIILSISVVVTLLLYYVIPYGRVVGYPLILLSTLVHEMGHGIAAILVGANFEQFVMYSDGSGVARWSGDVGRFGRAFISAGGLVGPAIGAGVGFVLGRHEKLSRVTLGVLGVLLLLSIIFVVRNLFGVFFVAVTALIFLGVALKARPWISQVMLLFVSTQLALSVFSRGDYLFTDVARTSQGEMPSDVGQMADALFLPYWFWGALCALVSVGILVLGIRISVRGLLGQSPSETREEG